MNGLGYSYAVFAQDDWKVTPYLTINAGLRYELHPPLKDTHYNTAAFLPDYDQNGIHGAVAVPNAKGLTYTNPGFAASIAPTPILTAAQAGLPDKCCATPTRQTSDRASVLRGGRRTTTVRSSAAVGDDSSSRLWASRWSRAGRCSASFVPTYTQGYDPNTGLPLLSFPSPFPANLDQPGTASFQYAFPIHYKDPTVQQWNLTFEHNLGHDIGMRLSYTGSHGNNLENFNDLNQVQANTTGYANQTTAVSRLGHHSKRSEPGRKQLQQLDRRCWRSGCRTGCNSRPAMCLPGISPMRAAVDPTQFAAGGRKLGFGSFHPATGLWECDLRSPSSGAEHVSCTACPSARARFPGEQRPVDGCAGGRVAAGRGAGLPKRGFPDAGATIDGPSEDQHPQCSPEYRGPMWFPE